MPAGNLSISQLLSEGWQSFKKNSSSVVPMFIGLQTVVFLLTYFLKAPFLNILMIPVVMLMQITLLKTHTTPIEKFDYEQILALKDPLLKNKIWRLVWTYIVYFFLLFIVSLPAGIAGAFIALKYENIALLYLAIIPLGILLTPFIVYWYFFAYIVLDQNLKGIAALKKSKEMIKDHWWKTFAIFVIAAIISGVISSVITSIGGQDALIGGLLMAVFSGLISVYFGYVAVAYYFDLKK